MRDVKQQLTELSQDKRQFESTRVLAWALLEILHKVEIIEGRLDRRRGRFL